MIGSTLAHTTIVGLVTLVPLLYLAEELLTPPDVLAFAVPVLHRRCLRLLRSARASPEYPQIAISAKKEGIVILEATVNADGLVSHVRCFDPSRFSTRRRLMRSSSGVFCHCSSMGAPNRSSSVLPSVLTCSNVVRRLNFRAGRRSSFILIRGLHFESTSDSRNSHVVHLLTPQVLRAPIVLAELRPGTTVARHLPLLSPAGGAG